MIDNPITYFTDVLIALIVSLIGAYVGAWWGVSLTFKRDRKKRDAETIAKMEYFSELMADAIDESKQRIDKIKRLINGLENNPYDAYWTNKITSQATEHLQSALQDDIFSSFVLIYEGDHERGKTAYKTTRQMVDTLLTLKEESRSEAENIKQYVVEITDEIRKSIFDFFTIIYVKDLKNNSLLYQINREFQLTEVDRKNRIITDYRYLFLEDDGLINQYFYEQNNLPPEQRDKEAIKYLSDSQNRFRFLDSQFKRSSKLLAEYLSTMMRSTSQMSEMYNEIELKIKLSSKHNIENK